MSAPVQVGPSPTSGGPEPLLTDKEADVLRLVAQGLHRQQIAVQLTYTEHLIDKVMRRVLLKLGASNAPHAVLLACQAGILDGSRRRHGDHAGYAAHVYRGEVPCVLCREGEKAYRAAQKRAKRHAA